MDEILAGGWNEAAIDEAAQDAVSFVINSMNASSELSRIHSVRKQVVKGMNYNVTFELENGEVWNAIVYRDLSGNFSITKPASKM